VGLVIGSRIIRTAITGVKRNVQIVQKIEVTSAYSALTDA